MEQKKLQVNTFWLWWWKQVSALPGNIIGLWLDSFLCWHSYLQLQALNVCRKKKKKEKAGRKWAGAKVSCISPAQAVVFEAGDPLPFAACHLYSLFNVTIPIKALHVWKCILKRERKFNLPNYYLFIYQDSVYGDLAVVIPHLLSDICIRLQPTICTLS